VATVARFAANPGPVHWEVVKCIFRYLSGTHELWLMYGETKQTLEGFADADGSMAEDQRAISGYTFLIDGSAVSWSSKRQEIVSLSTTESKYVTAMHGGKEAILSQFVGLAITHAYIWQYCAYVIRVHWMPQTGMP
jgi:hypothetical protein